MKILKIVVGIALLFAAFSELKRTISEDLVHGSGFVGVLVGFALVVGIAIWLFYSASKTKKKL